MIPSFRYSDLLATGASRPSYTPKALRHSAQGWSAATTLGTRAVSAPTLKGLQHRSQWTDATLSGLKNILGLFTQGSSFVATLGCITEPRWGSRKTRAANRAQDNAHI
jgi:hypothetical protein